MERTNETWLEQLRDDSPKQGEALEDLYRFLRNV